MKRDSMTDCAAAASARPIDATRKPIEAEMQKTPAKRLSRPLALPLAGLLLIATLAACGMPANQSGPYSSKESVFRENRNQR